MGLFVAGDVFALQASLEKPVSVYRCDAVNCMGTAASSAVLDVSQSLAGGRPAAPVITEGLQVLYDLISNILWFLLC